MEVVDGFEDGLVRRPVDHVHLHAVLQRAVVGLRQLLVRPLFGFGSLARRYIPRRSAVARGRTERGADLPLKSVQQVQFGVDELSAVDGDSQGIEQAETSLKSLGTKIFRSSRLRSGQVTQTGQGQLRRSLIAVEPKSMRPMCPVG